MRSGAARDADPRGLPPTLIQVDSAETLLDEVRAHAGAFLRENL
jgi:hypothetical protein